MIQIPKELTDKYGIGEYSEENYISEEAYYMAFLERTDYILAKLVEGSIHTADCSEELKFRELVRQEMSKLKGEDSVVLENKKTLEERTTQTEADTMFIAMMADIELEG